MDGYINISFYCPLFLSKELDLRVPIDLTLRELVQIVIDAYGVNVKVQNPSARNKQTGEILQYKSLGTGKRWCLIRVGECLIWRKDGNTKTRITY